MPSEDVRISRSTARLKKNRAAGPPIGVIRAAPLFGHTPQKNNLHTIKEENPLRDFPLFVFIALRFQELKRLGRG